MSALPEADPQAQPGAPHKERARLHHHAAGVRALRQPTQEYRLPQETHAGSARHFQDALNAVFTIFTTSVPDPYDL